MASVQDRWHRVVKKPDGTTAREQSARYGKGRRYRVHYLDPDGRQRSESFFDGEKRKADKFARDISADVDRGVRQGEVFGLSPDDVDWLRKVVHVRRQVKLVGGRRVFAPPKGGKERDVPLAESVSLRLSAHLAEYPAEAVTLPWESPAGKPVTASLMFTKPDRGAIWRNDWNRYVWHPALEAIAVAPGRQNGFHQLRHHYASVLLADGVDARARRVPRAH